ncbi:uncharacterized protein CIMG_10419 [Coccidioides immitis RS]|uniref:Aminoglycoside phosphotransferase domain-containing protein n=3 Tax=Coccidioides immitis TaxID=5501 RepID=J3K070_COCIM|nr:uncharacterized protein CIMG_10419 [Coccidioides immitis RS]EAS27217.3 hypothetical protein CIMG_10419 [Coccidioides immitis RS]KMP10257.1 hypothetical protein CIRG_09938 [Coccidioides immitis RMSCC 2394]
MTVSGTTTRSDTASQCSDSEHLAQFDQVRKILQLQNLPAFALKIRYGDAVAADSSCRVVPDPLSGTYHILFKLEFDDGVHWLLKVPANGYPDAFDAVSARALRSEALTMRLIQRKTKAPVPTVYHFDDTLNNELHCPFILMEYVDGRPLYEIWFDQNVDPEVLEKRRCRALDGVARAMLELGKFVFDEAGEILFDHNDGPCCIGPMKMLDIQAMLGQDDDDDDDSTIFCSVGPFRSAKSWFTCMLDRREPPPDEYSLGVYSVLRLFIDLAFPETQSGEKTDFVLSHPDFDIQNVLVSDDGSLRSLIDWDGVSTVPRCLGNEVYPSWLTRDWNPVTYTFDESATPGSDCQNNHENSPRELEHYRKIYQKLIEKILEFPAASKRMAANSLVLRNLYIAATDPVCTHAIVRRIFEEITSRTAPVKSSTEHKGENGSNNGDNCNNGADSRGDGDHTHVDEGDDDFFIYDVFTKFRRGNLSERNLQRLTRGFQALLI